MPNGGFQKLLRQVETDCPFNGGVPENEETTISDFLLIFKNKF